MPGPDALARPTDAARDLNFVPVKMNSALDLARLQQIQRTIELLASRATTHP